ncbi:NAD(P)-dependent oxidoreductase [uncultured Psychroserpens sp.]|uniref:NAD-dependent epimerase/dehydratase family protein n=1 Tax=uncultured Psychroserpens sp. TaxID=255436 RepID=UPI0026110841|nr:NAD(P)-dependent oxidoreductase [uncultured Psychroserpens sp.]
MKKKILVTGGSGFIGTNLIEYYKDNYEVLNLDNTKPRNESHSTYWKDVDILDQEKTIQLFNDFQPHYVLHMAARTDLDGKTLEDYAANTTGVEHIITAINQTPSIEKVIFASSRLVCEIGYNPEDEFDYKPSTIYGESKIIGEQIVRDSKSLDDNWIIVRPTSLWGPWFDIPYKNFFDSIKRKVYVHPKGKNIYKKFGFVGNCVHILDKLLFDKKLNTQTVYLSDFDTLEVKQWANIISNKFHGHNIKSVPLFVLKTLAVSGDVLKTIGFKSPPITSFRLDNILTNMDYDTTKVEEVVGKLPYDLEEGTTITYNWYKANN